MTLEKEIGEIRQEKEVLDQMVVSLREELVSEKLKCGNLETQFERVKSELVQMGVEETQLKEGRFSSR